MKHDDLISDLKGLIRDDEIKRTSEIRYGTDFRPFLLNVITIALDTARASSNPLRISAPFRSVFIRSATDTSTSIKLLPNDNKISDTDNPLELYKNDSFDFEKIISGGYLYWSAQTGKSVTLWLSTQGVMKPGSQISQVAGGVSIVSGSAMSSNNLGAAGSSVRVSVTTTATQICPSDTSRKKLAVYFDGPVWIGDASVNATVGSVRGIYFPGGVFEWENTAALYAITAAGTVTASGNYES